MTSKIKIQGNATEITHPLESNFNKIEKSFSLEALRGKTVTIDIGAKENDIIGLEFEDGGEWIGHVEDIHQIFGEHIQLRGNEAVFPASIESSAERDRGFKEISIKLLHLIRSNKTITAAAAKLIANKVDKKIMPDPGIYKVKSDGSLQIKNLDPHALKYLLFLHGTVSSFKGSFSDLYQEDFTGIPVAIKKIYGDRVIALQHYTLSESPWDNALQVLKALPKGSTIDIVSHSRGGLIADILASCDSHNPTLGYNEADIAMARSFDEKLARTLEEINIWAKRKLISVDKTIRVACPARGTDLLSNSLDHFLNGVLRAIGLAFGGKSNPVYQLIRGFIADVISARLSPDAMPGLLSMVPDSVPQKLINRPDVFLKNQLTVIEGDSEAGKKFWRSILVILSNLYYREANDFVVNTSSMRYGALRESGFQFFLSQDETTSHFNYFKNENTRQALLDAIITPTGQPIKRFESRSSGEMDRGIMVDLFKKYKAISYTEISGDKPVILLLPGVMGTHLCKNGKIIWLDLGEIGQGHLVTELSADRTDIDTTFIIGEFYDKLIRFLSPSHDIVTFGYDWRLSLSQAAGRLRTMIHSLEVKLTKHPISIIAHSMGGLVVRDVMRLYPDDWSKYISRNNNRVLLLGTPWLGSHLIMQLFTGHLSRVRQINLLDTHHDKNELIQLFNQYPGLYDLLPISQEEFEKASFWNNMNKELGDYKILIPPLLDYFRQYKSEIKSFNASLNLDQVYYLAGKDEVTTCTYRVVKNIFGRKLQYLGIPEGDGSVTWALGIPQNLPLERIYFAHHTVHGELANDESLFTGIRDIIVQGNTTHLEKNKPPIHADRTLLESGGYKNLQVTNPEPVSNRSDEALKILQGRRVKATPVKSTEEYIEVNLVHGDLKIASHPVMVGHFKDDGLVNAEAAIDYYYDGKLSDRHRISYYPGNIGESLILYDLNKNPFGAIVVGLGEVTTLTPYHLRKTIEAGVIRYAMHFRDHVVATNSSRGDNHDTAISCLCIGTAYGNLPMEVAMNALLTGISNANQIIRTLKDLKPIKKVEVIELYEHIAQHAYYQLSLIEASKYNTNINIRLKAGITKKTGAKRKYQFSIENSWWHNLTTRLIGKEAKNLVPRIQFTSASGIARVEEENNFTSQKIIHSLLDQMAIEHGGWNKEYSKTLFEILIPNAFKEIMRQQNNILWKMDEDMASIPWELLHDYEIDREPTFVRAGLIRQLYSNTQPKADIIHNQKALVIADPQYGEHGPNQLPGARDEGNLVHPLLIKGGFESIPLIYKPGLEIISHLFNHEYKVLHIAGHGTVSDNPNETGIILDNGTFISPSVLNNMSRLPEFVFINCCYSGTIEPGKEKLYQQRYSFAANIGTQLIRMGVHAVVVAGWPVNDGAALLFAETFYTLFLNGDTFGNAVKMARQACWNKYGESNNTWGAYQCYGDQWYRLVSVPIHTPVIRRYFTVEQVLIDLYNTYSETQDRLVQPELIEQKLNSILEDALHSDFLTAPVLEFKAQIFAELNMLDKAITGYAELRNMNESNFSVKSLEQYCNLRVKYLLLQIKEGHVFRPATLNKKIRTLARDFESLLQIGETPERHNIYASYYKNVAMIYSLIPAASKGKTILKDFLQKSFDHYAAAYKMTDPGNFKDISYSLLNLLTIHAMISRSKVLLLNNKKPKVILSLIEDIKSKSTAQHSQFIDFWEDVITVNALQCELFYAGVKQLNLIKEEIISLYSRTWTVSGTLRQKQTKLDHLDFMEFGVKFISRSPKWKNQMNEIIREIRERLVALGN